MRDFSIDAAVRRPGQWSGILGLLASALCAYIGYGLFWDQFGEMGTVGGTSAAYLRAEWATKLAGVTWSCLLATAAAWLAARSLRMTLGLPQRPPTKWTQALLALRMCVAVVLMGRMVVWQALGAPTLKLTGVTPAHGVVTGLGVWLMFAYDVPRLLMNAAACLRARLPTLLMRKTPLADLASATGRVRVGGVVALGSEGPLGSDTGGLVYERTLEPQPGGPALERVKCVSFHLTERGAHARVDVDPRRLLIEADLQTGQALVRVGDSIEVIGETTGQGELYRAGVPCVAPGNGKLVVLRADSGLHRRLLVAATVELIAGVGMTLAGVAIVVFWILSRSFYGSRF
jgi:hypothetical protein